MGRKGRKVCGARQEEEIHSGFSDLELTDSEEEELDDFGTPVPKKTAEVLSASASPHDVLLQAHLLPPPALGS